MRVPIGELADGNALQLNRPCQNSTKRRSPSLRRWVSLRSAAKRRFSQRGTAIRRPQWNGSLLTWRTQVGLSRTHYSVHLILTTPAVCVLDIDGPIVQTTRSGGAEPSPEQIGLLADMGFSPAQARKALRETVCAQRRPCPFLLADFDSRSHCQFSGKCPTL
jgi:hypothetical protein